MHRLAFPRGLLFLLCLLLLTPGVGVAAAAAADDGSIKGAVVDPLGRVITSLPLGAEGVLDSALPKPIAPTLYARTGDGPVGLVAAICLLIVIRRRARP